MKRVLLGAALLWPVPFPGGQTVHVPLPAPGPAALGTAFRHDTVFNPQRTHAVVSQCFSAGVNAEWCDLYLVRPSSGARPLTQGHLGGRPGVRWTPDGRFIVAYTGHRVRLWTLDGAVRGLSFADQIQPTGQRLQTDLQHLLFRDSLICLTLQQTLSTPVYASTRPADQAATATGATPIQTHRTQQAYHWPTLQRATPSENRACQAVKP